MLYIYSRQVVSYKWRYKLAHTFRNCCVPQICNFGMHTNNEIVSDGYLTIFVYRQMCDHRLFAEVNGPPLFTLFKDCDIGVDVIVNSILSLASFIAYGRWFQQCGVLHKRASCNRPDVRTSVLYKWSYRVIGDTN